MNIKDIIKNTNSKVIVCEDNELCVSAVYAGDFLSNVMGKAPADCVWITVMNNVNVAGVAVLADIKVVVLCEGVKPDPLLTNKCKNENIVLLCTDMSVYECCKAL